MSNEQIAERVCGAKLYRIGRMEILGECILSDGHSGLHVSKAGELFPADPVAVSKAWRDKHEKNYAELVTFVKALSAAPVYQGMYLLAYWRKDAQTLLKLLNGER